MSGVEIVGLVLGTLPIVISAVNSYHESIKSMVEYWNYGPTLQLLQGRLNFQATLYEDSIRRLLIASGLSVEEIHILLDNVDEAWRIKEAWSEADLSKRVEATLGPRHFLSFTFAVEQIEETMKRLMQKLKLDAKGKPSCVPDQLQYQWRRIARTFSQRKQDELIEQFKEYNSAIAAFVLNKEILSSQNHDDDIVDVKSYVQYFDLVRREACSLYELLQDNWKCSCENPHQANLQLSFRGIDNSTPVFKVCFSSSTNLNPKSWRKTCIYPGPRNGSVQPSDTELVCTTFFNISQQATLDSTIWASLDWQIKADPEDNESSTVLHLRSLLAREQSRSRRSARFSGLTERQRRQIAVSLSYSVLQFYDSPWMHDLWGEEDIYFFTGVNKSKRLEIGDPCFSRSFPQRSQGLLDTSEQLSSHFLDIHIQNKPLFALGIVLLELCLNMTFDELHDVSSINTDQPDAVERYQIVMENLDGAFDEWGETFGQVVQRCLNPEFGLRPSEKRLDFDKFRCRVYEGIVAPLEEDLKSFM